ncbi:transposase [Hominimerdicola sp. 21CYCFAH17_S]
MTWFTDSVFEKMMTQKPDGRRESAPPVPHSPACDSCPYQGQSPCVGYCIRQLKETQHTEPER